MKIFIVYKQFLHQLEGKQTAKTNLGLFVNNFDSFKRDIDGDPLLVVANCAHSSFQFCHSNLQVKQRISNSIQISASHALTTHKHT